MNRTSMLLSVLMLMKGFSCSAKEETKGGFCCKTAQSYRKQANPAEDNSEKKDDEKVIQKSWYRPDLPKEVFDKAQDEPKDAMFKGPDPSLKKEDEKDL